MRQKQSSTMGRTIKYIYTAISKYINIFMVMHIHGNTLFITICYTLANIVNFWIFAEEVIMMIYMENPANRRYYLLFIEQDLFDTWCLTRALAVW